MLELGDRIRGRDTVVPIIRGPEGLPMLDPETKKAPDNLAENYGDYIRPGHGFAQVSIIFEKGFPSCSNQSFMTGVPRAQVSDRAVSARARIQDGHDRRWSERRPSSEESRRRHSGCRR